MGPSSPSPMGEVWTILKESSSSVMEESRDTKESSRTDVANMKIFQLGMRLETKSCRIS